MLPTWQKRNANDKSRTRRNECGKQKLHVENTFDVHFTKLKKKPYLLIWGFIIFLELKRKKYILLLSKRGIGLIISDFFFSLYVYKRHRRMTLFLNGLLAEVSYVQITNYVLRRKTNWANMTY